MARVFKWIIGFTLVTLVLVLAGLAGVFRTDTGRSFLRDAAVAAAAAEGWRLSIGEISGALPFEARVRNVVLADAKGEFLNLGAAEVRLDAATFLEGRVRFETVALDDLSVTRVPEAPRTDREFPPEPAAAGPLLPGIPITVRALSVSPLTLGADIAGETIVLDIRSDSSVDPDRGIDARFTVTRLDGDGIVAGELTSDAALTRLTASVTGESAKGGWISRLLRLPGEPAIQVTLEGDGPIGEFEARYGVFAGENLRSEGVIRLSSIKPLSLAVVGEARIAALLPSEMESVISGAVAYGLAMAMDKDASRVSIKDLKVDTPEISARGEMVVGLKTGTLDARASATLLTPSIAADLIPGLNLAAAGVDVVVAGPLLGPTVNVTALIRDLYLAGNEVSRIEARLEAVAGEVIDGAASIDVTGLRLPNLPAGAIGEELNAEGRIVLEAGRLGLTDLKMRSGPAQVHGDASMNIATGAVDFLADVSHGALEHFAPPLVAGRLESTVHGGFQDGHLKLQLGGRVHETRSNNEALAPLVSSPTEFWVAASQVSASGWNIESAEIGNEFAALSARGALDLEALSGDVTLSARVDDIAVLDGTGTVKRGSAELSATLSGEMDAAEIDWTLLAKDLSAEGMDFPLISGAGNFKSVSNALTGTVSVDAETPAGLVQMSTSLSWDGAALGLTDIRIDRSEDTIRGALVLEPAPLSMNGALDVVVRDLGGWVAAVTPLSQPRKELTGELAARIEAEQVAGKQRLVATTVASNVSVTGETPLGVGRVDLNAVLDDALGTPLLDAGVVVSRAVVGAATVDRVQLIVAGGLAEMRFEITGEGAVDGRSLRLNTAGTASFETAMRFGLERLKIEGPAANARLVQPTEVKLSDGITILAPTSLALFGGTLDLAGEMTDQGVAARLEARDISLPPIARLAGAQLLEGILNAEAEISGAIAAPNGQFKLTATDVTMGAATRADLPVLALAITGTLNDGALESQAALSGIGEVPLTARVATRVPGGAATAVPVRASVDWRGGLGEIALALPIDGALIAGEVNVDLDFEGEFDIESASVKPLRASGLASIRDGRLEHFDSGAILDPINVAVRLDGSRLVIEKMTAGDTTGGELRVSGAVDLGKPARPVIALNAVMEAMTVTRRDDAEVQLDADIDLRSNQDRYLVSGKVINHQTEIRLIGALPATVEELDVEEVRDGVAVTAESGGDEASGAAPPIDLDVHFSAPGRIFVRGRGLDSEWGGDIQVSGSAAAPSLVGAIAPVRGGFEFAGRRFELGEGGVSFSGGADLVPDLDISAIHEDTDFSAMVAVSGTPSKPEIELSSDPSYPEDEILAKILFGKFTARLTATEALQLAQSTRTLLSGEPGTLDKIRGAIGVDVLTFAPGASEGELGRLKAGKYVRDDLFVGVERGAAAGSARSIVEWYVSPKVTVEGTVGSSSESTLGIQRRWEY